MYTTEFGSRLIGYLDEDDIAECRVCHVKPVYKESGASQAGMIRCPKCGIKTGTSTSGLGAVAVVWNRVMVDGWEDPRDAL